MAQTVRFGVSLDLELLDRFDKLIKGLGYDNRSEAVRDLIRGKLVEERCKAPDHETYAVALLVYPDRTGRRPPGLERLKRDSGVEVLNSLQVYVSGRDCLEIVVMKGKGKNLAAFGQKMISLTGIKQGSLHMGTGDGAS